MNLLQYYVSAVEKGDIIDDPLQREILTPMQRLEEELKKSSSSWFGWAHKQLIRGVYLYGPVGVGKTFLIDLFYQHLKGTQKARFHFHHFMQQIDTQLRRLQGNKDPLQLIAREIAKKTRIIFFDEFLVHDVAHAMILAELLQALMNQGVILVFTSNTRPDDLYLNGVQRARFLPAIALIKKDCDVLFLNENRDYRLGREPLLDAYLHPLNVYTHEIMEAQFAQLAQEIEHQGVITIQNRVIPYFKCSDKSIWFDFDTLCNLPRSQLDYLELAQKFDHLFLSNIPLLTEHHTSQAILFIHLIDVMYDTGVNVIVSAAGPVEELYVKGEMCHTFKRTLSRLIEMQSQDYLGRHPRRMLQNII